MEEVEDFLLRLYRAARESGPDEFQDVVLADLQQSFAFSSAMWVNARVLNAASVVPTALHATDIDPAFLESLTSLIVPDAGPSAVQVISLFRAAPDALCSDREKHWLERVMPHLGEALRINRALHSAGDAIGPSPEDHVAIAMASSGELLRAEAGFLALLSREWSGFDGHRVPAPLLQTWQRASVFTHLTRHARIDGRRSGELVFLTGHPKSSAEALTARQLEIADLYAQGLSHKAIAQRCGLAPATVRNHLATVYAALHVHGKVEMMNRLRGMSGGSK